jgi:triphosphatase
LELELGLDPDDAARLPRLALLAPWRGKARSRAMRITWHDSPDRKLASQHLALAEQRPAWRLERLLPDGATWPPGAPPPVLASAHRFVELGHDFPEPLVPIASFEGRARVTDLNTEHGPVVMTLMSGAVRTLAGEHQVCRLRLEGAMLPVQTVALALAGSLRLAVPTASLAAEAIAIVSSLPAGARRDGAPELPTGLSVAEAFAHVAGHLTDVILHYAPAAAGGKHGPEPVHQMRVAVRRLRSAVKVFQRALRCPPLDAADAGLKALAGKLAPTRDWDVFVTETAATVAAAFPAQKPLRRLMIAAERRRRASHAELREFLASADFRRLGIELACLAASTEWHAALGEAEQAELATSLEEFAARVLSRRLKRLLQVEGELAELEPTALHVIRLNAKRLRYAAEIFAPLFPAKTTHRYLKRLSRLQDSLGRLNDAAVATGLLAELSGTGGSQFASGLVLGFSGAHNSKTRNRLDGTWQKFRRQTPFWD